MNYLDIAGVVAGPRLSFDGTDPATGVAVRTTVYSGHVTLAHNRGFRGAVRGTDTQPIAFFVPDSAPYPQPPAKLWLELSLRRIRTTANPGLVTFGADNPQVTVAADPRGGEHQWLQISFQNPTYENDYVEFNYRVTVQE
jgi:hypothetical protein